MGTLGEGGGVEGGVGIVGMVETVGEGATEVEGVVGVVGEMDDEVGVGIVAGTGDGVIPKSLL